MVNPARSISGKPFMRLVALCHGRGEGLAGWTLWKEESALKPGVWLNPGRVKEKDRSPADGERRCH